jgi:hypothetical protein
MGYIAVKTFLSPGIREKNLQNPHKLGNSDYMYGIYQLIKGILQTIVHLCYGACLLHTDPERVTGITLTGGINRSY